MSPDRGLGPSKLPLGREGSSNGQSSRKSRAPTSVARLEATMALSVGGLGNQEVPLKALSAPFGHFGRAGPSKELLRGAAGGSPTAFARRSAPSSRGRLLSPLGGDPSAEFIGGSSIHQPNFPFICHKEALSKPLASLARTADPFSPAGGFERSSRPPRTPLSDGFSSRAVRRPHPCSP